jgi:hypothetical protein
MNVYRSLWIVLLLALSGCNRSGGDTGERLGTSSYPNGGKVTFDVISKSNTLRDISGEGFLDRGHYSMIFQAKTQHGDFPVSGLTDNRFYTMYENGIHIDESKVRVSQDTKNVTNQILLLLDFSGSIIKDCSEPNATTSSSNLCYQIVNSSEQFVDKIIAKNQTIAIWYFNSQQKIMPLYGTPTDDSSVLKTALNKLYSPTWRAENLEGFESTNLYGAVENATEVVCQWFQDCEVGKATVMSTNKQNYDFATIVTFTDGRHNVNNDTASALLPKLSLYDRNYYYTIGLGDEVDDGVLRLIGKDGYFKASQTDKLDKEFDKLGEQLSSFSNSFYRLDYCPAQQGGALDLRINVDDPTRKFYGDIRERVQLINGIDFRCDL